MAEKSVYTKVVAVIAVVLFGAMGYGGYRFIQAVSEGAAGIQNTASPVALPEINLEASAPLLPVPASDEASSVSTGEDVVIKAGDFSYTAGEPNIRVSLTNKGNFTVSTVYISLALYINDSKQAVAENKSIPITLDTPLEVGGTVVLGVPADGVTWRSEAVQAAKTRKILAQVVGVSDEAQSDIAYSQSSAGKWLTQVPSPEDNAATKASANTQPPPMQPENEANEPRIVPDEQELAPQENESPAPAKREKPRSIKEELGMEEMPTGETGVISYERTRGTK
ncbi:hypothetical protein [Kingella oralis]|uniref:Uncharacterized protein n=1 Tax=Kingella oralis ATCC 51147 TaxID=629741 RepID=C4GF97_9NEIS|nr:hypothetical protein [Kingella oralis]EEP68902.1 hypothetical protein GCWU000324_00813 [Kingella oralis ATCC 51147]QMT41918.1 hypothetical protein H3L93_07650 [Kingella oralis]